jgi:hypothetical protein
MCTPDALIGNISRHTPEECKKHELKFVSK